MPALDDMQLLREYATRGSDMAFTTLVSRHLNMVYSVALRHAADPHHAEEITQAVFIILARKAGQLRSGTVLAGWLFPPGLSVEEIKQAALDQLGLESTPAAQKQSVEFLVVEKAN